MIINSAIKYKKFVVIILITVNSFAQDYAKLKKIMDDNELVLNKVYSPAERNALRRMEKMLSQYGNVGRSATSGSDTFHKQKLDSLMTVLEAGLKLKLGEGKLNK